MFIYNKKITIKNFNIKNFFPIFRKLTRPGYENLKNLFAWPNNKMIVEAITHKNYRDNKLVIITWTKRHQICLELLKICISTKDIDDKI